MSTVADIFSATVQSSLDSSPLSDRFREFNKVHSALKQMSKRYFHLELPTLDSVVFNARAIHTFTDYNLALCTGESIPELAPAFYLLFAKAMNKHNDSGYAWAYLENGVIVFDDKMTIANPESFCVMDHETTDCLLGRDEVAVTRQYFENSECLAYQQQLWETKYWKAWQEKKGAVAGDIPDVHSKEVKAAFAKKRKALEDVAAATAAKKQKPAKNGKKPDGMDTSA
ncbi:hypothetical protein B0H13DRAFT_2372379 [Mycena leptocephala]|nr:hypothetical protein B0H13DRAFT_2372379 [Mycena leptocephala]